jgi:FAD synthetase
LKKILIFGTFDLLHEGHKNLFEQAKKYGELIAVIALDETVKKIKGKYPKQKQEIRKKEVEKYVKKVYLGKKGNKYKIIKEINPDIICLGYDQQTFTEKLKELGIKIIKLKPYHPEKYKTSIINGGNNGKR